MQVAEHAHEVGEVLQILFGKPLIELVGNEFRQILLVLVVQVEQALQGCEELVTIVERVGFSGLRSDTVRGDHVGLLGVEISAHVFQQLLHGGHVSNHFVGLAGFFNCLCSLIALRCFAFVQRHDVIIARLGCFLRFGLGRLGCFLRVRVCSIGSAVLIIFLQRVEEDLDVFDLLPPLFRSALQNVAVGELGCRVGKITDVEGADVQLAVVGLHTPHILVQVTALLVAVAQAGQHGIAIDGAFGIAEVLVVGFAGEHFEVFVAVFVNVHTPQVDWALQILVQVREVHLHGLLQSVHRIVVAADVQVALVYHHVGCAGTTRSEAPLVLGAVCRIADQRLEGPLAGALILRATEQSEGLLGVFALAGHHGDIQVALESDHIPYAATEHVVGHSTCRIVVQALILSGDGGERILTCGRVRGSHDSGTVVGDHAGDELVIDNGQATNTSAVSLL